jgi:hypothetical protein
MVSPGGMANGDGIRITRGARPRRELWGAAVLAVGVVAGRAVLRSGEPPAPPAERPVASAEAPAAPGAGAPAAHEAAAPPSGERPPTLPNRVPRTNRQKIRALRAVGIEPQRRPDGKRELDAAPVIDALNEAGIHDGIAAFPPPGTDPPKAGLIVPDDWVLPEGYVRHYQATDDGQRVEPILMFSPDFQFFDADHRPIAIPKDRVVPPELAPPGLPIRRIVIPAPTEASRAGG